MPGDRRPAARTVRLISPPAARTASARFARPRSRRRYSGQPDTDGDDATARVYIHRLRKRLADFYAAEGADESDGGTRLILPAGTYALRLGARPRPKTTGPPPRPVPGPCALRAWAAVRSRWPRTLHARARLVAGDAAPPANAFWQPFLDSDRPIVVVVGDYYMFGEIDEVRPEQAG